MTQTRSGSLGPGAVVTWILMLLELWGGRNVLAGVNAWTATGLPPQIVHDIQIDPQTPTTLYIGTAQGILKSTDGALSWQLKNKGLPTTSVYAIAIDQTSPANIYLATQAGIFRSRNAGDTWDATTVTTSVHEIVLAPSMPQVIYAIESNNLQNFVHVSLDKGEHWRLFNNDNGLSGYTLVALAVAPANDKTVYASAFRDGGRLIGPIGTVFQTIDGGFTWTEISSERFTTITPGPLVIDTKHSTILFLATSDGVYKSEDGGKQWQPTGLPLSTLTLTIDPRDSHILYAGTRSGVFQSTDGGVRWASLNTGFADFQTTIIPTLAIAPQNETILYAGVSNATATEPVGRGVFAFQRQNLQPPAIFATFESPENGQDVSGITVLRGWAFATQPNDHVQSVNIYLRNGSVEGQALCCSERRDVQDTFPQFPAPNTLNSGWGTIVNANILPAKGQHIRVGIRTSTDEILFTEPHTVHPVIPGGLQFLDTFDLATATVRIEQDAVILNGVVVRDQYTQEQKRVNLRFHWTTNLQSLRMIHAETVATLASWRLRFSQGLTNIISRVRRELEVTPAQAALGIISNWESPNEQQVASGISILRGWAFTEEPPVDPLHPIESIQDVTVQIDGTPIAKVLCCTERGDVQRAFPRHDNAFLSGWALQFNYGILSPGRHTISLQLHPTSDSVPSQTVQRTVHVVRVGGFMFVDQFDLSRTTARIEGEDIVLSGVVVRDKASQQSKVIEVHLRWVTHSQSLSIVAAN